MGVAAKRSPKVFSSLCALFIDEADPTLQKQHFYFSPAYNPSMSSISEAKYRELKNHLDKLDELLKQSGILYAEKEELEKLKKDSELLSHLFSEYQARIKELGNLIQEYHEIHKLTRIRLRKLKIHIQASIPLT